MLWKGTTRGHSRLRERSGRKRGRDPQNARACLAVGRVPWSRKVRCNNPIAKEAHLGRGGREKKEEPGSSQEGLSQAATEKLRSIVVGRYESAEGSAIARARDDGEDETIAVAATLGAGVDASNRRESRSTSQHEIRDSRGGEVDGV